MKSPTYYKIAASLLSLLLVAGGVFAAILIREAHQETEKFRKEDDDLRSQLADVTLKQQKNQEVLDRLQNDPEFLDRYARTRLGYVKPDELSFRFDVDPLTGTVAPSNNTLIQQPSNNQPRQLIPLSNNSSVLHR